MLDSDDGHEIEQSSGICSRLLSMRIPLDLYQSIGRDAAALGVSMSDVGRMRLKTGGVPALDEERDAR
jgi:hypothetical protein